MQTILIVDDEPNIVEGLASQLQQSYGDRAIIFRSFSGTHALSILQNNQVDVILSDVCMPDLDGLSLIEETEKLWPRAHFVFLSGFDDFQYIHRASKSPLYHGYLLKTEGDDVVLQKIDQEIRLCEEESRAELEQGELRRQYGQMQEFLQRAALESILRGGASWEDVSSRFSGFPLGFDAGSPVFLILGKDQKASSSDRLATLLKIDRLLSLRLTRFCFVSLLPEEGFLVWLIQSAGAPQKGDESYLYALLESIQQRLSESEDSPVSFFVGTPCEFPRLAEKYGLLRRLCALLAPGGDRLVMAYEETCAKHVLGRESDAVGEQLRFTRLVQQTERALRAGTREEASAILREALSGQTGAARPEQLLTLLGLTLQIGREVDEDWSGEEEIRALTDVLLQGGVVEWESLGPRLLGQCEQICRLRELRDAHDAQTVVAKINRYIEESVESYDLSLTELARRIGFNPSYLSRFYRIHTGRKLSEQIDGAKLQHAKELLLAGELIKNVAERTGFASPSAFILFFKRNTGMTPGQFYDSSSRTSQK